MCTISELHSSDPLDSLKSRPEGLKFPSGLPKEERLIIAGSWLTHYKENFYIISNKIMVFYKENKDNITYYVYSIEKKAVINTFNNMVDLLLFVYDLLRTNERNKNKQNFN